MKIGILTTNGDVPQTHYAIIRRGLVIHNTANPCYNGKEWQQVRLEWSSCFKHWNSQSQDNEYPGFKEVELE